MGGKSSTGGNEGTGGPGEHAAPLSSQVSLQQAYFSHRYKCRELERSHFPALEQLEDFDLVIAIGHHQLAGTELSLKSLVELRIGSPATVQRRLRRLKTLGFVVQKRSKKDHRTQLLSLHTSVLARVAELLGTVREAPAR